MTDEPAIEDLRPTASVEARDDVVFELSIDPGQHRPAIFAGSTT